ncbi:class I SAM-dependent methyltransferase [Muriicola sp. Z0-33]|uniref:class I SAM-dependent methyltransferase n=1 Tax=Muriicola sp. Z0-33 TaxID=2816957 RepID=UPI0022389D25|nr:class I SAM-dependent methyltransferase [Muriicola sp. Z0-33]MCW5517349.1 class I SAM-dependent methyltransferase [Muriicola sp. Z0-33]
MKKALDIFSKQANTYKKFRPTYPKELYDEILQFVTDKSTCWDCATGNGQVAAVLSKYFNEVYATDISKEQLSEATKAENIYYKVERAEKTSFTESKFDLITVAQAMHWFDMEAFNNEVKRVAKNGAIIAIWGYGLLRINKEIDTYLDAFCNTTLGPYWNPERKHVDKAYSSVIFNYKQINEEKPMHITAKWSLEELEGYLNSWSSVQHFISQHPSMHPVPNLISSIKSAWGKGKNREVNFPLYLKVGRVIK